jgi:hypothetical protein
VSLRPGHPLRGHLAFQRSQIIHVREAACKFALAHDIAAMTNDYLDLYNAIVAAQFSRNAAGDPLHD